MVMHCRHGNKRIMHSPLKKYKTHATPCMILKDSCEILAKKCFLSQGDVNKNGFAFRIEELTLDNKTIKSYFEQK